MPISIEKYDFEVVLACFWMNEQGNWEGALKDSLQTTDAKIIVSEKIILIIQN